MDDGGSPEGVFNLVNGNGVGVGSQMSCIKDYRHDQLHRTYPRGTLIFRAAARYA